jgi:hypothetical protein
MMADAVTGDVRYLPGCEEEPQSRWARAARRRPARHQDGTVRDIDQTELNCVMATPALFSSQQINTNQPNTT